VRNVLIFQTFSDELLIVILKTDSGSEFESKELDSWMHGYTAETFMTIPPEDPHHDACVWCGQADLPHALVKIRKSTTGRQVPLPECQTILLSAKSVGWEPSAQKK